MSESEKMPDWKMGDGEKQEQREEWLCPYDGSALVELEDTPDWYRCGTEGPKHYFRHLPRPQNDRQEVRKWLDVLTNRRVKVKLGMVGGAPRSKPFPTPAPPPPTYRAPSRRRLSRDNAAPHAGATPGPTADEGFRPTAQ